MKKHHFDTFWHEKLFEKQKQQQPHSQTPSKFLFMDNLWVTQGYR
jgi:hypothetical protein